MLYPCYYCRESALELLAGAIMQTFGCTDSSGSRGRRCGSRADGGEHQFGPTLTKDGDMWCALYGPNIQEGCAGFGRTPEEAITAWEHAYRANAVDATEKGRR